MSGWIWLAAIACACAVALAVLRVARPLWMVVGAGIALGAAGYALQGRPGLIGAPKMEVRERRPAMAGEDELRDAMWGRFSYEYAYAVAADGLARAGATAAAANAVSGGLQGSPRSAQLWTRLGTAIVAHDGGNVISPAARLAFDRAIKLAPDHPAPLFFYGIAMVQTGDLVGARRLWQAALARTPRSTSYRDDIALRLALLDQLMQIQKSPRPAAGR